MRYKFTLNGRTHYVQLEEHADGPKFVVDGESFSPNVTKTGKGTYEVELDGQTRTFHVHNGTVSEGVHALDLEVHRARPELVRAGKRGGAGDGTIKPPMPGKVVEIHVSEGDEVAAGDVVVVLEAMKMQNDIKTPIAGTVTKIAVKEGENVEQGAKLVVIEPAKGEE